MDPDIDDTNHHFLPVAPDEEGGDVDDVWGSLVPMSDHGLPPKKVSRRLHVNDYTPESMKYGDHLQSPLEPEIRERKEDIKSQEKSENIPAETHKSATDKGAISGSIVPASSQGVNRIQVNEIGDAGTQRSAKMYPTSKAIRNSAKPRALSSRRRKGEWDEEQARGSLRWMFYTGGGVIALLVAAVLLNRPDTVRSNGKQSTYSQMVPDEAVLDSREDVSEMMAMLLEGQEEAERIFANYATAKSTADFIGSVRHAEEIAGLLEMSWKPLGVKPGWQPDERAVWSVIEQDDLHYSALEGVLPDLTSYRAYFQKDEDGLKMDWKATVGYCSADFNTLQKGLGDGGEVRAWLTPVNFHTFPLPEGEYRSFQLASPDRQERLWAYAKIGSELERELIAEFTPSQITGEAKPEVAVIVGLERGPNESLSNQWMIAKLVRLNWLDE